MLRKLGEISLNYLNWGRLLIEMPLLVVGCDECGVFLLLLKTQSVSLVRTSGLRVPCRNLRRGKRERTTTPQIDDTTNEIDTITSADSLPTSRWIHSTTDTDISRWAQFHPLGWDVERSSDAARRTRIGRHDRNLGEIIKSNIPSTVSHQKRLGLRDWALCGKRGEYSLESCRTNEFLFAKEQSFFHVGNISHPHKRASHNNINHIKYDW